MSVVQSVNVGVLRSIRAKSGVTGIDKRPVDRPVSIFAPGPRGWAGSGVEGDVICDRANHGGNDQAVYAFEREELDWWQEQRGLALSSGVFGENLTTLGLDVTGARIGEIWKVGDEVELQVTSPRVPCATFAAWMEDVGWLRRFTLRARPGAYLRVLRAGRLQVGDAVTVLRRPDHEVSIALMFRAVTREKDLLPSLLPARAYLDSETLDLIRRRETYNIV